MKNYFGTCTSLNEAKKMYRDLMLKNHPDVGGDDETAKEINNAFDFFCARFMSDSFASYTSDHDFHGNVNINLFSEILAKVCRINCRVEVIGFWVYAFESFGVKDQLKEWGFWWSVKHKAWVYSGMKKRSIRTKYSTDEVRKMHGSEVIRDKDNNQKTVA